MCYWLVRIASGSPHAPAGKTRRIPTALLRNYGSPPRQRGTRPDVFVCLGYPGLTPAHAGNTRRWGGCIERPRAHPPPTQGTLLDVEGYRPGSRLTPAPAGNTWKSSQRFARDRAHPRACGEHGAQHDIISMPGGSPPRLRGTLSKPAIAQNLARLTPDHAWKTY